MEVKSLLQTLQYNTVYIATEEEEKRARPGDQHITLQGHGPQWRWVRTRLRMRAWGSGPATPGSHEEVAKEGDG